MTDEIDMTVNVYHRGTLPRLVTYVGECCREWVLAVGFPVGTCGHCGQRPKFKRSES